MRHVLTARLVIRSYLFYPIKMSFVSILRMYDGDFCVASLIGRWSSRTGEAGA